MCSSDLELPLRRLPVPSVIVVHDVGPLVAPAFYSFPKRLRYQAVMPRACRLATSVVCVSQATLMSLHAATGIDPRRCEVIGEGPQLLGATPAAPSPAEPYLLYVGSLEARKNVNTLIDAVALAEPPLPATLLIVGPVDARATAALQRRLVEAGAADRVRYLGFVSPDTLTTLYRDASALVLPSLYEGFGLPVLEAMQSGTPVVASDIPSVREVAGDAALYVSRPLDAACWGDALARICADPSLRNELARHGAEAAAQFSWSHVGQRFSDLLYRVAEHSGARAVPRAPSVEADAWPQRAAPSVPAGVLADAEPPE